MVWMFWRQLGGKFARTLLPDKISARVVEWLEVQAGAAVKVRAVSAVARETARVSWTVRILGALATSATITDRRVFAVTPSLAELGALAVSSSITDERPLRVRGSLCMLGAQVASATLLEPASAAAAAID